VCNARQRKCPALKPGQQGSLDQVTLKAKQTVLVPDLKVTPYNARRAVRLPLDPKAFSNSYFKTLLSSPLGEVAAGFTQSMDATELSRSLHELNPTYKGPDILAELSGFYMIPVTSARVRASVPKLDLQDENSPLRAILAGANVTGVALSGQPQVKAVAARPGVQATVMDRTTAYPLS
jgi:hypothetical protein